LKKTVRRIKDAGLKERVKQQILRIVDDPTIGKPMRSSRKQTREVFCPAVPALVLLRPAQGHARFPGPVSQGRTVVFPRGCGIRCPAGFLTRLLIPIIFDYPFKHLYRSIHATYSSSRVVFLKNHNPCGWSGMSDVP
jgi:hypothetical protein